MANNFIWWIAGIMVAAKLIATIISYAFGACGGIFSPTLFLGGMCGCFIGGLASYLFPLTPSDRIILSAVGMSSCLGAVVRAPLTSVLIVFEMTHQFALVPGLMLGAIVSVIVSHGSGKLNFYDAILLQDGHELIKIRPPLDIKSWQNLPVSAIINPNPVIVTSLSRDHLAEILDKHPYNCFPVQIDQNHLGQITRTQIESALKGGGPVNISPAMTCCPEQTLYDVGNSFIESPHGIIVVVEHESSKIIGILTLHDLLRAQAALTED